MIKKTKTKRLNGLHKEPNFFFSFSSKQPSGAETSTLQSYNTPWEER
jgi:hypothetical protein